MRRRRVSAADGRAAISEFLAWGIVLVDEGALIEQAFDIGIEYGCSLYDGSYVALARAMGSRMIHVDRRLANSLGMSVPEAVWISDYIAAGQQ